MRAVKFEIDHETYIEERGENSWAIKNFSNTLGKDGKWEYESLPSSRTTEYLQAHRFSSADEAFEFFKKYKSNAQK